MVKGETFNRLWRSPLLRIAAPAMASVGLFSVAIFLIILPAFKDNIMTRRLTAVSFGILAFIGLLSSYIIWQGSRIERVRRRAEQEKGQLEQQLHQAQKMAAIGQLASGVAHDFNNLVTVVLDNTELIRKMLPPDSPVHTALATIAQASRQAAGVAQSLLAFSRNVPADKRPVNLQQFVEESARIVRGMLPSSIEILVDQSSETPLWLYADATQLQQVVMNLAINARDAMPEGGTLCIRTSQANESDLRRLPQASGSAIEYACLVVSDTGTGMAPAVQGRIFEPFFTTKPRGQGTGLGLPIIRGIVREHGGQIEVHSEPGQGSTFRMLLPCIEGVAESEMAEPAAPTPRGHGELVLLAEDHQFIREMLASTLQSRGYEVYQVADGLALMDTYHQHRCIAQMLVVDVDLPKRSGLDCLRDIRGQGGDVPAILMTGNVGVEVEPLVDGRSFLLRRPFRMTELTGLISEVLATRHLEKAAEAEQAAS